jgi:RND family efflux transporter MFP subunit
MFKNLFDRVKKMNRWLLGGIVVVVIALIAFVGSKLAEPPQEANAEDTTVEAFIGDLTGSINGSGHLEPEQDVSLSMATTGIVKKVNVKVGDEVKKGDVLVLLDDADAQQAVLKAELAVQQAQISVSTAEYDLKSRTGWKPNENSLAAAEANLKNAEAAVKAAQANYDQVAWLPWVSSTQPSMQLEQATNNYNKAAADMNYVLNNRPDISPAQSSVANAQLAQSMAEIDLLSAQNGLKKMTLIAPFDGTITAVNVAPGESAAGPVVELVTMNALEVVLDIDEVDIGSVDVDQPATITFDAYPGVVVNGEVKSVSPRPENLDTNDIVQYEVHVSLDKTDVRLLVGMTASATIETYNLKDVLLVANSAIYPDTANGTFYVRLVGADGKVTRADVTIGPHNAEYTQVLSGIKEGDILQINDSTPLIDITSPQ